jgi:hypothetical protein
VAAPTGVAAPTAMTAKEAVGRPFEATHARGVRLQRPFSHTVFGTAGRKSGGAPSR